MIDAPKPLLPSLTKLLRPHGGWVGLAVVLVIFLVGHCLQGGFSSPAAAQQEPMPSPLQVQPGRSEPKAVAPQVSPPPALSPEALKPQLEKVLAGIREANLQKDLAQFLAHYSPSFPQLAKKILMTSDAWQIYDYLSLEYKLTEVRPLSEDTAKGRVTWKMETKHRSTKVREHFTQTYRVWFVKESGEWHIKNLEKAP